MRALGFVGCLVLAACGGPAVGVTQIGPPRANRGDDCPLELVTVGAGDMAPGAKYGQGGEYEMIGVVAVGADEGTNALSPEMRKLVRPKACQIGGEQISLLASGSDSNGYGAPQQSMVFQVWAHRKAAPAEPEKF